MRKHFTLIVCFISIYSHLTSCTTSLCRMFFIHSCCSFFNTNAICFHMLSSNAIISCFRSEVQLHKYFLGQLHVSVSMIKYNEKQSVNSNSQNTRNPEGGSVSTALYLLLKFFLIENMSNTPFCSLFKLSILFYNCTLQFSLFLCLFDVHFQLTCGCKYIYKIISFSSQITGLHMTLRALCVYSNSPLPLCLITVLVILIKRYKVAHNWMRKVMNPSVVLLGSFTNCCQFCQWPLPLRERRPLMEDCAPPPLSSTSLFALDPPPGSFIEKTVIPAWGAVCRLCW